MDRREGEGARATQLIRPLAAFAAGACAAYLGYAALESPASGAFEPVVVGGSTAGARVALTFDDGPNPPYTEKILAELRARHARATFFVVGRAARAHPQTIRAMVRDGDAVESHGWDHRRLDLLLSRPALSAQLRATADAIEAAGAPRPAFVRPPHGVRNAALIDEARAHGEAVVLWSEPLAGDWAEPGTRAIVERVLAHVANGDILVLHDGDGGRTCLDGCDRAQTVAAVGPIVDGLRARGFALVTVPELLRRTGGR